MKIIQCILISFFLSQTAFSADTMSPRTAALGGAGHAGPNLADSIFLNPSYASFLPSYSFAYYFLSYAGQAQITSSGSTPTHGRNYAAVVHDGRSQLFQAGVGYSAREDGQFIHFGASRKAIENLGFGIGGKAFFNNDTTIGTVIDSSFSTTFIADSWLQLALVVDNIIQSSKARQSGLYREIIIGAKANLEGIVLAYFDPHWVPDLPSNAIGFEAGLEFPFFTDLYFRLGTFKNSKISFVNTRGRGYSIGIGWMAPKISIDYALYRVLATEGTVSATNAHVFGASVYF